MAVVPVILFHAGIQAFSGGFVGVDIFFVISGFLITGIIVRELDQGDFSIVTFYERRARRIFPALFFVMLVTTPLIFLWSTSQEIDDYFTNLLGVSFFVSNIVFWSKANYFSPDSELNPLLHTWSLAVEEQYYFLMPVFLILCWKYGRKFVLPLLVTVALTSLALSEYLVLSGRHSANFYLLPTRAWELLIGAICSFYYTKDHQRGEEVWAGLGLMMILGSIFLYDSETPFPSVYALLPTVGTGLVLLYAKAGTVTGRVLSLPPFVYIGLLSYSAYLWHQPIFAYGRIAGISFENSMVLIVALCLIGLLSYLSWRYVEKPFRAKEAVSAPMIFKLSAGVITGTALVSASAVAVSKPDGALLVEKVAGDVGHQSFNRTMMSRYVRCTPEAIAKDALVSDEFFRCRQSRSDRPVTVVLVGDSHAEHLFPSIATRLPDANVAYYIKNGVAVRGSAEYDNIFQEVSSNKAIKVVILTMFWAERIAQFGQEKDFRAALNETVRQLVSSGKKVILVDDVPNFAFTAKACKWDRYPFVANTCTQDRADYDRDFSAYNDILEFTQTSNRGVERIAVADLFCDRKKCSMTKDGALLYRDADHLSLKGADLVGARIVDRAVR